MLKRSTRTCRSGLLEVCVTGQFAIVQAHGYVCVHSLSTQYRNRPRRNVNIIYASVFTCALDILRLRQDPNIMRRIALVLPPGKHYQDPRPRVRHADIQTMLVLAVVDYFHLHVGVVL